MREWAGAHAGRARFVASLGSPGFVCAVKWAAAMVGNSSSAIVEAPTLQTPSLNVGDRQAGRERASSAVDVSTDLDSIREGLAQVLAMSAAGQIATDNPWGDGHAAERIASLLESHAALVVSTAKPSFNDLDCAPTELDSVQGENR